jgi:aryl-alcohol dehydrogenase-like predicted oxidoreductase
MPVVRPGAAGPDGWIPLGRPEYLIQQVKVSLRHLGVEQIALWQLHRIDPKARATNSSVRSSRCWTTA